MHVELGPGLQITWLFFDTPEKRKEKTSLLKKRFFRIYVWKVEKYTKGEKKMKKNDRKVTKKYYS